MIEKVIVANDRNASNGSTIALGMPPAINSLYGGCPKTL